MQVLTICLLWLLRLLEDKPFEMKRNTYNVEWNSNIWIRWNGKYPPPPALQVKRNQKSGRLDCSEKGSYHNIKSFSSDFLFMDSSSTVADETPLEYLGCAFLKKWSALFEGKGLEILQWQNGRERILVRGAEFLAKFVAVHHFLLLT